jgi:hypothetical protein
MVVQPVGEMFGQCTSIALARDRVSILVPPERCAQRFDISNSVAKSDLLN